MAASWSVAGYASALFQAMCRGHFRCAQRKSIRDRIINVSWLPCADLLEDDGARSSMLD